MRALSADRYHAGAHAASAGSSKPPRQSAFARLFAKLHHARQLQADREIRRYQSLLQVAREFTARSRDR